jgi:hypothetical protein
MKNILLFVLLFISSLSNANDYLTTRHYENYCLKLSNLSAELEDQEINNLHISKNNTVLKQQYKEAAHATIEAIIASIDTDTEEKIIEERQSDIKHIIDIIYDNKQDSLKSVTQRTYKECLEKYRTLYVNRN